MKTKNLNLTLSLLCALLLSCQDSRPKATEETIPDESEIFITNAQYDQGNMSLIRASIRPFETGITCNGSIDVPPSNRAIITALWGGLIENNKLLVGDEVAKGQALVSLVNPLFLDLQQDFLSAKAELEFLEAEYQRQKQLQDEKINSIKQFAETKNKWNRAEAEFQSLKQKLNLLHIDTEKLEAKNMSSKVTLYSPISGTVSKVHASLGKHVNQEEPIMEIIDDSHLHLELNVFEKDLQKIVKGQKIRFRVPESSGQDLFGEVHLIGNTIDEKTRTVKVHGHLEHDQTHFAIGMFIEAFIETSADSLWSIPKEAVFEEEGKQFILVKVSADDGRTKFKKTEIVGAVEQNHFLAIKGEENWITDAEILLGAYHFTSEEESEH